MGGWRKEESFSDYTVLYDYWLRIEKNIYESLSSIGCAKNRSFNEISVDWIACAQIDPFGNKLGCFLK